MCSPFLKYSISLVSRPSLSGTPSARSNRHSLPPLPFWRLQGWVTQTVTDRAGTGSHSSHLPGAEASVPCSCTHSSDSLCRCHFSCRLGKSPPNRTDSCLFQSIPNPQTHLWKTEPSPHPDEPPVPPLDTRDKSPSGHHRLIS